MPHYRLLIRFETFEFSVLILVEYEAKWKMYFLHKAKFRNHTECQTIRSWVMGFIELTPFG